MRRPTLFALLLLLPVATATVSAAEQELYRMEKSEKGFVRMNTQTGEMSICEERAGQLVCKLAADERAAFQDDIDRLEQTVEVLDERVAKLETSLAARLEGSLPTEEEFKKSMSYVEQFFRGFIGIVKELETENSPKDPASPGPQKT